MLFLQVFLFSLCSRKIPFPHLTKHCHKCLFHMDNYMNQVGSVIIVERISRSSCTSKNIKKKNHLGFFGSWSETLLFQTFFIKSTTQTNDRFSCYCDSFVESLRLSALVCVYLSYNTYSFLAEQAKQGAGLQISFLHVSN